MIIPSKEEYISTNLLVQGARVLRILKDGALRIDEIRNEYPSKRHPEKPTYERVFDVLTYLYVTDFIFLDGNYVGLKSKEQSR